MCNITTSRREGGQGACLLMKLKHVLISIWSWLHINLELSPYQFGAGSISIWSQLHIYMEPMEPAPYRYGARSIHMEPAPSIWSQLQIDMEPAPISIWSKVSLSILRETLIWSQLQIDMEPAPYRYGASSIDRYIWSQLAPTIWS